jgi:hypothetical protein
MKKTSNADHGSVAEQREEMALRHLEHEPRRRRRREDGRRHLLLLPPQDDVRRCIHQSAQGRKKKTQRPSYQTCGHGQKPVVQRRKQEITEEMMLLPVFINHGWMVAPHRNCVHF